MQASGTLICPAESPQFAGHAVWRMWAERSLLVFLLVLFAVRGFIPAWRHLDSDFANYYLAAHVYREGYPVERIYDWTWFQRQKDHLGLELPLVGFSPSTLPSTLLILPLSSLPPLQANRCWLVISLGSLFLAAAVLKRITNLTWRRIGVLTFLAMAPLHDNFLLGQIYGLMFLLLALAAWLYFGDRPFLSGIVLAVAAAVNIYPAFFLLLFLMKRQWRAAAGLACGMAGACLLSLRLFGATACRTYFREVLPAGLRGEIIDPYATAWDSLNALLHRLFIYEPELNPAPVAHLPMLYGMLHPLLQSLILVVFLWAIGFRRTSASRQKLEWAIYCFLLLLLSSEPFAYHFVILILTASLTVSYLLARNQSSWACTVVVLYALACVPYDRVYRVNPHGWQALFCFPRLFCMVLLAGALLWIKISTSEDSFPSRLRFRSLAWAALTFFILTTTGFVLERRHLAGQFDNYASRVTTSVGSAIAVNPVASGDGVLFEALVPKFASRDAYVIRLLRAGVATSYGGNGDWFYPTSTVDGSASYGSASYGSASWAEVASKGGSRIIRFDLAGVPEGSEILTTEVVDAQQPAVSAHGEWMAYVREVRGRGSLWIRPLVGNMGTTHANLDREVAGPQYDVREAAFSYDAQIIFSSSQPDRYHLYSIDSQSGNIVELKPVTCSARYPALSPDGQRIAFSCERGGVWQLTVMNLASAEQHQLTRSDCNSITPAWLPDSKSLIYATDCGRALGITALSKLSVVR